MRTFVKLKRKPGGLRLLFSTPLPAAEALPEAAHLGPLFQLVRSQVAGEVVEWQGRRWCVAHYEARGDSETIAVVFIDVTDIVSGDGGSARSAG